MNKLVRIVCVRFNFQGQIKSPNIYKLVRIVCVRFNSLQTRLSFLKSWLKLRGTTCRSDLALWIARHLEARAKTQLTISYMIYWIIAVYF